MPITKPRSSILKKPAKLAPDIMPRERPHLYIDCTIQDSLGSVLYQGLSYACASIIVKQVAREYCRTFYIVRDGVKLEASDEETTWDYGRAN